MFSIVRFKAVAEKEFLELKRNKLFFIMTILAPIVLFILFAYGFPLDPKDIPVGIVDMDKTQLSRSLIDAFSNTSQIFKIKKVVSEYRQIKDKFLLGQVRMVLVIPHDFQKSIKKNNPVSLQLLLDASSTNSANLIGNYAGSIIESFKANILEEYFLKHEISPASITAIELEVSGWYNSSFRSEDFIFPGIIALIMMFFPPLVSAISLAKEKETGSILNMYCSSISRSEYLLGKMLPYIIISFINCLLFIAFSVLVAHVPLRGSLILIIFNSLFYVATSIGLGLLVAVFVNSQIAAILITSMLTLTPTFLYSGFMVPVSNIEESSRFLSYLTPATYYIDLLRKVMVKGVSFDCVKFNTLVLMLLCFLVYFVCIKSFKKRVG